MKALALLLGLSLCACTGDIEPPAAEPASEGSGGATSSAATTGGGTTTSATTGGQGGTGGSSSSLGMGCDSVGNVLLCDDFESGDIDASLWTTRERNSGSLSVASDNAIEGNFSLRLSLGSQASAEAALQANTEALFPLPTNAFFGRVYLYVSDAVPQTHSKMITARGQVNGESGQYRLDINGGNFNSRYTTPSINQNVQHGALGKLANDDAPVAQWLCIEWQYDGVNNEMRYWMDGQLVDEMTVLSSEQPPWLAPAFDRFEIGWQTYQAASESEYIMYLDALVLDSDRIGCGN